MVPIRSRLPPHKIETGIAYEVGKQESKDGRLVVLFESVGDREVADAAYRDVLKGGA